MKKDERKKKGRPEAIDVMVGQNIRVARNGFKMSQEKLAEKVGLTFQQIQKYERGTNRVAPSRLCAIADALQVPVISLFPAEYLRGEGEGFKALQRRNAALESRIRSMISAGTGKEFRGRI